jgi:AcrR family transcriptional regulator
MSESATLDVIGKRERTKTANRQAILEAAKRVFAQLGYEAATVRDIIRGTDLASGTFYNYFKSKDEVFEALADDGAARFRPILRAQREQAATFKDYLEGAVRAYFNFVSHESINGVVPRAARGPHVHANTPQIIAVYEEVRDGVADAIARGLAPKVDADYLACACIGMCQEVADAMLQRSPPDIDGAARFVVAMVLGGLPAASGQEAQNP